MRPLSVMGAVVAIAAAATFGYLAGTGGVVSGAGGMALGAAVGLGALVGWILTSRADRPHEPHSAADHLRVELERARRRSHPVALLRVTLSSPGDPASVEDRVRSMDNLVIRDDSLLLVMPEADRAEAESALARLRSELGAAVGGPATIAVFPDDGVTEHALIAAVHGEPFFAEPLGKAALKRSSRRADAGGDVAPEAGGRAG